MNEDDEQRIAARLARIMAMMCNCNSKLEDLHAGCPPVTRTGDYSDVFVLDADGQRTPWPEVSRVDDIEMRDLMRQIVNRLYAFHIRADDPALRNEIERWLPLIDKWDEPSEDSGFLGNNATIKEGLAEAAGLGSDHPKSSYPSSRSALAQRATVQVHGTLLGEGGKSHRPLPRHDHVVVMAATPDLWFAEGTIQDCAKSLPRCRNAAGWNKFDLSLSIPQNT